jgi:hypothetical protein
MFLLEQHQPLRRGPDLLLVQLFHLLPELHGIQREGAEKDTCSRGMRALICDPRLRTYNKGAACNSAEDTYKHNPWRAP